MYQASCSHKGVMKLRSDAYCSFRSVTQSWKKVGAGELQEINLWLFDLFRAFPFLSPRCPLKHFFYWFSCAFASLCLPFLFYAWFCKIHPWEKERHFNIFKHEVNKMLQKPIGKEQKKKRQPLGVKKSSHSFHFDARVTVSIIAEALLKRGNHHLVLESHLQ